MRVMQCLWFRIVRESGVGMSWQCTLVLLLDFGAVHATGWWLAALHMFGSGLWQHVRHLPLPPVAHLLLGLTAVL